MSEPPVRPRGVARTVIGCILIVAVVPVFLRVVPARDDLGVVVAGAVAFAVLVAGVVLAGGWLGVFERRRPGSVAQQGCLQLLVTFVVLLAGAIILYYVVFYGAGAFLRAEA